MTNPINNIDPYVFQLFGCVLVRTANLNIPDNITTLIPWQSLIRDTSSFWDIATPETITVRFTGLYLVTFNGTMNAPPADVGPQLVILSSSGQRLINNRYTQSIGIASSLACANVVMLRKTETIQCSITQNSGGNVVLNGDSVNFPTFSLQLIGQ